MIDRSELNKHLTNDVILRIDFVPIANEKVDEINEKIAEKFLIGDMKKFDNTKDSYVKSIDIRINDPSIQDFKNYVNVNEVSKIKSYEYFNLFNNMINIKLIFNRQFAALEIDQSIFYHSFEKYKEIIDDLVSILTEEKLIITRFGFRKFNDVFFKEGIDIYQYVKKLYFNLECNELVDSEVENIISEKRFSFKEDFWNINLITHTSKGTLDNINAERVAFDVDVFVDTITKLEELSDKGKREEFLTNANNKIFNIYINLLNDKMIDLLKTTSDFNDENIILGVDFNGEN